MYVVYVYVGYEILVLWCEVLYGVGFVLWFVCVRFWL